LQVAGDRIQIAECRSVSKCSFPESAGAPKPAKADANAGLFRTWICSGFVIRWNRGEAETEIFWYTMRDYFEYRNGAISQGGFENMKSLCSRIFGACLAILVVSLSARCLWAQQDTKKEEAKPESGNQMLWTDSDYAYLLSLMDADQDGSITRDEWGDVFARNDENGDNRLSPKEIQSIIQNDDAEETLDPDHGRLAAFKKLDSNQNDAIDGSEWPGKAVDFDYIDANLDGTLSREEFLSSKSRFWNEPFENLDFNDDGIISSSEWLDSEESFNRMDRDEDGIVDRREFYDRR
jgi:Ca2+-binding EF-hand superfamily protein